MAAAEASKKPRATALAGERIAKHMEIPDTGAVASLINGTIRRGRGRTDRECSWSGNGRRRAGLGVRTGPGTGPVGRGVEPHHALGLPHQRCEGRFGRVEGCARMRHAADRAGAVMGAMLAGLTGLVRAPRRHRRSRSAPHGEDRRRRCWPPSRHRSVQEFAPRGPSGRWEENSATAGASKTTSST